MKQERCTEKYHLKNYQMTLIYLCLFLFSLEGNLEDYFQNEKLYTIVSKLTDEQKEILELKILHKYNSKQIAKIKNKSDSRIRHIYNDTINEINKKMKE